MFEDEKKDDIDLDEDLDDEELDLDDEDEDLDEDADEDLEKDEDSDEEEDEDKDKKKDEPSVEELKKQLIKKNEMLRRYKKRLNSSTKTQDRVETPAKPAKKKEEEARLEDSLKEQRFDFRVDNPQLKTKEVDQIERYARANNLTFQEAARSPIVKMWVDKRLKARRSTAASASSSTSSRGALHRSKTDWTKLSDKEFEEHLKSQPR